VEKIAQNVAQQLVFLPKLMQNLFREKVAQKYGLTTTIFKQLPEVSSHPMGPNSPNLVTLNLRFSVCRGCLFYALNSDYFL
jgi:hypothetical protein